MNKKLTFGTVIFIIGLLISIFGPIFTNEEKGALAGLIIIALGVALIIIFLIIERVKDNKQFKKDFSKKDLRP